MERRYQIFVSSTFADLQEERQAVVQALLSLDHFPAGMETFPASDDDALTLIKGVIDDSDYYTLVVGGRYGSTNEDGVSYTEMEFDYALAQSIPVLAFIHEEPQLLPVGKTDQKDSLRERLDAFIAKVQKGHHVKYWKNPDDLKAKVIQSVAAETKRNPRVGWVRANRSSDPMILEKLRQENDGLKSELEESRNTPPPQASMYASGGDWFDVQFWWSSRRYSTPPQEAGGGIIKVTWDDIIYVVGPSLMEEASENQMKSRLSGELQALASQDFGYGAEISHSSFETIKVQLVALGLIRKSTKKHTASDTNKYWSLTPFGETSLLRMRAIPKPGLNRAVKL